MAKTLIKNGKLITPKGQIFGDCLIQDQTIAAVGALTDIPKVANIIDAAGSYLAPGLIDLQLNGAFGMDFTHAPETIWPVAARLPSLGLTGFLPTIITSPLTQPAKARQQLAHPPEDFKGAIPLGLHFEGPFLNPEKKGAHNADHILFPEAAPADEMAEWTAENRVRLVTLAPEMAGAQQLIKRLVDQGVVVSAGHSMATFDEANAGFAAGIRYVTHLFNAMPPLHHREPGLVAAALNNPAITIGIIPDGVHVHPDLIKLVWRLAPERINGVTDAMAAMGNPPGEYVLGDYTVTVTDIDARLPSGTLAGSIVQPLEVIKNLVAFCEVSLSACLASMTTVPAGLLGLGERKGKVSAGYDADLILFDEAFNIQKTIVMGEVVYDRQK